MQRKTWASAPLRKIRASHPFTPKRNLRLKTQHSKNAIGRRGKENPNQPWTSSGHLKFWTFSAMIIPRQYITSKDQNSRKPRIPESTMDHQEMRSQLELDMNQREDTPRRILGTILGRTRCTWYDRSRIMTSYFLGLSKSLDFPKRK